jgi:hypothetical protein
MKIQASLRHFGLPLDATDERIQGIRHILVEQAFGLQLAMSYHERHLPHCYPPEATHFLTWRLFGSLRGLRLPGPSTTDPGKAFAENDRFPDTATDGLLWLKDRRVAALVAGALDQGENEYRLYERFAWVIMPNHVHVVTRPFRPLPEVIEMDQGLDCRSANLFAGTYRQALLA